MPDVDKARDTEVKRPDAFIAPHASVMPEPAERYISRHAFLVPVLREARVAIERVFGDALERLRYEVFSDPETPEPTEQLYLHIGSRLPAPDAFALLTRLDQEWWLDAIDRAKGRLVITVEHAAL